jgi:hypothetical protein
MLANIFEQHRTFLIAVKAFRILFFYKLLRYLAIKKFSAIIFKADLSSVPAQAFLTV